VKFTRSLPCITGLFVSFSVCSDAQTVLRTVDFENYTTGPGELEGPYNGVLLFNIAGNALTDPVQGVVNTSPIGTGKAGYIGGPSLATGNSFLNFVYFPGSFADAFNLTAAEPNLLIQKSFDFAIERGLGGASSTYFFYSVSATSAAGAGFSSHARVLLLPDNTLQISDNPNQSYIDTGVSISPGTAYNLSFTLDYELLIWSATLLDLGSSNAVNLADGRPIESIGYNLGNYTKSAELNTELVALPYDVALSQLSDVLFIDNYNSTAIPEPGSASAIIGLSAIGTILFRRRRRSQAI